MKPLLNLLLLLLAAPALPLQAQPDDYYKRFNGGKLYVVYLGNKAYDSALKKAFTRHWTASPIAGFITKDQVDDLIADKQSAFAITRRWGYEIRSSSYGSRTTAGIYLVNGGKKKLSKYWFFHHIADLVYYDWYGYERQLENARYRLPITAYLLNKFAQDDTSTPAATGLLKDKILLINKNHLGEKDKTHRIVMKEALSAYKHKYEIAEEEKIEALIEAKDSRYALLIPILNDQASYAVAIDLGTYERIGIYGRKKTVWKFPWIREEAFEEFNNSSR